MAHIPTFENLPSVVNELQNDVTWIKRFLQQQESLVQNPSTDDGKFLTVPEAARFLGLATQTVYGLIHRKQIPCMKRQKRVYFSKQELIKWIESGRMKTRDEIAAESHPALIRRGGSR
ncbi:MAG: helix-turn-helix domain-containing protein [Bacteroidota bacterium]